MRKCLWCGEEVPPGNVGPFCDGTHKWSYNRKQELEGKPDVTDKPPAPEHPTIAAFWQRNNGIYHGVSPRGRR